MIIRKIYNYLTLIIIATILVHLWTILHRIDLNPDPAIDFHGLFLFLGYSYGWASFVAGLIFFKFYLDGKKDTLVPFTVFNIFIIGYSLFLFLIFSVLNSNPAPLIEWITGPFKKISIMALSASIVLTLSRLKFAKIIHETSQINKSVLKSETEIA